MGPIVGAFLSIVVCVGVVVVGRGSVWVRDTVYVFVCAHAFVLDCWYLYVVDFHIPDYMCVCVCVCVPCCWKLTSHHVSVDKNTFFFTPSVNDQRSTFWPLLSFSGVCAAGKKVVGGGGMWRGDLYCRHGDTLEMKTPREGDCTASVGSSFQSLTVREKCVTRVVSAVPQTLVLHAVSLSLPMVWGLCTARMLVQWIFQLYSVANRAVRRQCSKDGHFIWRSMSPALEEFLCLLRTKRAALLTDLSRCWRRACCSGVPITVLAYSQRGEGSRASCFAAVGFP